MNAEMGTFIALVFSAVFLMMISLSMPVFGENKRYRRKIKERINNLGNDHEISEALLSLRKERQKKLGPIETSLENSRLLAGLKANIEQSGHEILAYRLVLISLLIASTVAWLTWVTTGMLAATFLAFCISFSLPLLKIYHDRQERMAKIEEQLPEAIDVMKRALQAGHPFSESVDLVAKELDNPIKREFEITFSDLNYGNDMRWALIGLLERIPSINVMAFVTSVLVQRETGGNLAEILGNLSKVIRGRFRFHRKVKTLSAEGRLSAWVLMLVPFVLFVIIHLTTPSYLPTLLDSELGRNLIVGCVVMMVAGIFWIKKIIRIEV
jgi:tight adherence protein B